ncbi:hypothetical protein [Tsukamurella sp. NPDC003166]|uniref:hypothetical protein n=1 Tax=Tsukamurella sp. NPDC003166 TaxID=3154444 RepID=UPI0033A7298F
MDGWRRVAAVLVIAAASVAVGIWYHGRATGTFFDDATDGECLASVPYGPVAQLGGHGATRATTVPCDGAQANYVVVAHSTTTPVTAMTCPDGKKDVTAAARIRIAEGARTIRTTYGWGSMCLAPVLHAGSCYPAGGDRSGLVRTIPCDLLAWQVTRRIDGASDITRCTPATGLVLSRPAVTYCEVLYEDAGNPLAGRITRTPPPAG